MKAGEKKISKKVPSSVPQNVKNYHHQRHPQKSIFNLLNNNCTSNLSSSPHTPILSKFAECIVLVEKLSLFDPAGGKVKSNFSSTSGDQEGNEKTVPVLITDLLGRSKKLPNNSERSSPHIEVKHKGDHHHEEKDASSTVLTSSGQPPTLSMKCHYCGDDHLTERMLKEHVAMAHLSLMAFKCQICRKRFKSRTSLRFHKQRGHHTEQQLCPNQNGMTPYKRKRGRPIRSSFIKNKPSTFPLYDQNHVVADTQLKPITIMSQPSGNQKSVCEDYEKEWWVCRLCFRGFFGLSKLVKHKFLQHSQQQQQYPFHPNSIKPKSSTLNPVDDNNLVITEDANSQQNQEVKIDEERPVIRNKEPIQKNFHLPPTVHPDAVKLRKLQLSDIRLQLNRVKHSKFDQISKMSGGHRLTAIASRFPWTRRQRSLGRKFYVNFSPPSSENVSYQESTKMNQENVKKVKRKSSPTPPPPTRERLKIIIKRVNRTRRYVCSNSMEYVKKLQTKKFGHTLNSPSSQQQKKKKLTKIFSQNTTKMSWNNNFKDEIKISTYSKKSEQSSSEAEDEEEMITFIQYKECPLIICEISRDGRRYVCKVCNLKFHGPSLAVIHVRTHTNWHSSR